MSPHVCCFWFSSTSQVFMIDVEAEDVIVAGTDGVVYDNLYNDEITVVVVSSVRPGLDPKATAQKIADLARSRAVDQQRLDAGGKLDDITAVVSYVTPASKAKHRSTADSSSFCFCHGNN
ncbi:unnamed protein product [Brassica oleracea var. botrytis]